MHQTGMDMMVYPTFILKRELIFLEWSLYDYRIFAIVQNVSGEAENDGMTQIWAI
jgi:hypothetical protein